VRGVLGSTLARAFFSALELLRVFSLLQRQVIFTISFLWSPYVLGQTIIFYPVSFFLSSFFFLFLD